MPAGATTMPVEVRIDAADGKLLREHVGKRAVVTGVVDSAKLSSTGKVLRITFKNTADSGFNAVVFPKNLPAFETAFGTTWSEKLAGKNVEISGTIALYRDSPQIILDKPEQLTTK
jgi:DNA/RNA endonuclease YhcR with UshA esterase domain